MNDTLVIQFGQTDCNVCVDKCEAVLGLNFSHSSNLWRPRRLSYTQGTWYSSPPKLYTLCIHPWTRLHLAATTSQWRPFPVQFAGMPLKGHMVRGWMFASLPLKRWCCACCIILYWLAAIAQTITWLSSWTPSCGLEVSQRRTRWCVTWNSM